MQLKGVFQPAFYIFRDEILQEDYIKDNKLSTYTAMQKKACMAAFLFKDFLKSFQTVNSCWDFFNQLLPTKFG